MFFEFEVYKDKIKPLTPMSGFSGNVNYYECRFSFSDDWAGFAPLAVFVGKETYSVPVIDGICKIPSVVLEDVGEIFIGVCASNGDEENLVRRSTGYIAFDVLKGAFKDGADYIETTVPDMWEIYEKEVLSYCERAENAADYIESIKPVTEEGEQEISGLKTFKAGIITNNISPEAEELLAVNAECIEIAGGEYAKVYSPEGRIFIGTDESEIIVSDTVDIRGAEVFINGKEIKDHLEKEDLQFDGNSITVEEVITNGVTIDGKTIEAEGGKLIYGNETIPFEKDVMHKSGDEEIEGVKSFKGVTKVKVISGMPESEDDDTQNILIDATNPTGSGGGFVNIEADTEINLKALEIYLTSETGYVSVNGSEVATAENLPRITEETKLNKVTVEAFEIRDDGGRYGDIDGTEVFDYEDEEGNPHYASAIKIKTDKLFHNDKEVATKDDISSALGNIETALDTAIALCDSLIGGAV